MKLTALIALSVGVTAALATAAPIQKAGRSSPKAQEDVVSRPALLATGYRTWTRVNRDPHEVASYVAALCRGATEGEQLGEAANPHLGASDRLTFTLPPDFESRIGRAIPRVPTSPAPKWLTVYVNSIGAELMLHRKSPRFPVGSVIIKEKLPDPRSHVPELLTVMVKRERGYNPGSGDWQFAVLDGLGRRTIAEGKLQNCQSCHAKWKSADFVSRAYLDPSVRAAMR